MSLSLCTGTVVVVEDDEDARELLRAVLERQGYRVLTARDGVDALALLRGTDNVCFVLLDLFMPGMDGFAVLRSLSADPQLAQLPVCISTSAPEAVPFGWPCLAKPIDLVRLFAMIEHNCRGAA